MFDLIPFGRNERNLFNYLDNVERSFWDGSISNMAQFRCDVQDKGDSYLLEAELPGFEREDIGIDLDGTTLVITARHSSESGEKDKDGNYLRRERKFGSFSRSFDVSGVDTEHISAAYKNGVLELTLPKQAAQVPQASTARALPCISMVSSASACPTGPRTRCATAPPWTAASCSPGT